MFPLEVFITIAFWAILYTMGTSDETMFDNINWHAVPLFLLTIDLILNSFRFIWKQFIAYVILALIYLLCVNLPYSLAVWPVYGKATNWRNWITYVFIIVAFVIGALAFLCGRLLYIKCKAQRLAMKMK